MKFLITNDDGVHAPGLAALARAASTLGEVVVLAPHEHVSGCSHQATTHRPLELRSLERDRYELDGSPVDCIRVALAHLAPDVDWVLAGVNEGGNLGADTYLSGTVAAAREACLLGKPAIAISQYRRQLPINWELATGWTLEIARLLIERGPEPGRFWNVNLPHPADSKQPACVFCPLDPNPLPVQYSLEDGKLRYQGNYHERARTAGHDVDVCFSGSIAVTLMQLASMVTLPAPRS